VKNSKPTKKSVRRRPNGPQLSVAKTRNLRARALAGEDLNELARAYKVTRETCRNVRDGRTKRGL
jgi:hypothetical protein